MSRTERGWSHDWLAQQIERGHQRWQRAPHIDSSRHARGTSQIHGDAAMSMAGQTSGEGATAGRDRLTIPCPGTVVATREDATGSALPGSCVATAAGAPPAKPQNGQGSTQRPFKLSTYTAPESDVLKAVLLALRINPRVAWCERMSVGAYKIEDRFVRFGFKGCSDIIGQLKTGEFLAVEVKRRNGTVTEAQAEFLGKVERAGGMAFVARDVADVIARLGA